MTSNTAVGAQVSGSTPLIRISGNLFFCFLSRAGRNAREEPTFFLVKWPAKSPTPPASVLRNSRMDVTSWRPIDLLPIWTST